MTIRVPANVEEQIKQAAGPTEPTKSRGLLAPSASAAQSAPRIPAGQYVPPVSAAVSAPRLVASYRDTPGDRVGMEGIQYFLSGRYGYAVKAWQKASEMGGWRYNDSAQFYIQKAQEMIKGLQKIGLDENGRQITRIEMPGVEPGIEGQ